MKRKVISTDFGKGGKADFPVINGKAIDQILRRKDWPGKLVDPEFQPN